MRRSRFLVLGGLLILACGPRADTATEEKAIRSLGERWNEALVNQNDSLIATFYAADATLMPPNEPAVTGTDKIRQYWAALWPMNAKLVVQPASIHVSADGAHAIDVGTWTFEMPGAQGVVKDNGKYVVHWRKDGGEWKAVEDIWNSDNPVPGAPAPSPSSSQ